MNPETTDKDDANIASNAAAGKERMEAFAFEKSVAECFGNARREEPAKEARTIDFEEITISRDARDGSVWKGDPLNCYEEIEVEVEILAFILNSEFADDGTDIDFGKATIIEDCHLADGRMLFRKGDIIRLTEDEEDRVRTQFLDSKRR